MINEIKIVKARLQTQINALFTRMTIWKHETKHWGHKYNLLNDKVDKIQIYIDEQKINDANLTLFFYTVFDVCFCQRSNFSRDYFASSKFVSIFLSLTSKCVSFFFRFFFARQKSFEFFLWKDFASLSFFASLLFFASLSFFTSLFRFS